VSVCEGYNDTTGVGAEITERAEVVGSSSKRGCPAILERVHKQMPEIITSVMLPDAVLTGRPMRRKESVDVLPQTEQNNGNTCLQLPLKRDGEDEWQRVVDDGKMGAETKGRIGTKDVRWSDRTVWVASRKQ